MAIAMTDGRTYENSLDMLFAKDMPSREETDRQQKMKDLESTMPPDMRGPPSPGDVYSTPTPSEDDQLHDQPAKDQNDPSNWGMDESIGRTGSAMVPNRDPKFHEVMNHMDYLIDPEAAIPANARPTQAETPPEKSAYQNFTDKLEELSKSLNPSFIPTAEQFRDAPWKEKLGFIIASSFMFAGPGKGPKGTLPSGKSDPLAHWTEGLAEFDKANPPIIKTLEAAEKEGSKTAANLLGEYRKIDDPVVRAEFSKIVKDKIASASEGGENAPSDITNPTIRGMKEGSDWSEVITRPDGTKETVYDTSKIERLRNLLDNGMTFTEIGDQMGVSRNSVNSMVRRLRNMDAEEGDINAQRILKKAEENKAQRLGGIHSDKIPEIRDLLKEGESIASISRKLDIPAPSVRTIVRSSDELAALRTTGHSGSNWTPAQDKLLTRWYNDPNSDLFGTPPGLEKRSQASIDRRIKALGLDKQDSAEPFVPKGAVSAPEKGSGSGGYEGPVNTELEGKSGLSTPKGLNDPAFRALQAMRRMPDNENITPENYGQNTVRRIISEHMDMMRNRDNPSGLTSQDITDVAKKHGPNFEEFQGLNPEANSASVFGRFLDRQMAVEKELKMLDRERMDPYDKEVLAQKNRKDLKTIEGGKKDASLNWLGQPSEPGYRQAPWGFSHQEVDAMSPKEYSTLMNKTIESPAYRQWIEDFHAGKHNSNKFPETDVQKQVLGDSPRERAIKNKNSTYPTTEDAYAARAYDQFHGEDVDAYAKGKVARILGSVDKTGKVIPKSGLTDDLTEFMRGIMKESVSKNVDLTKKENWKYADNLADEFTKTAIVAKRVPLVGLGFDPSLVVNDVRLNELSLKSTIGGAYMAPGPEGKGSDATYSNAQGAGTMVHESIHRGLEKLRTRKDLRGAFANLPADEESLTRYIMYKYAGDPEGEAGSVDAKQRAEAITRFENSNGETYGRYKEAIDKITKAAQDEIKKRRPGGHR